MKATSILSALALLSPYLVFAAPTSSNSAIEKRIDDINVIIGGGNAVENDVDTSPDSKGEIFDWDGLIKKFSLAKRDEGEGDLRSYWDLIWGQINEHKDEVERVVGDVDHHDKAKRDEAEDAKHYWDWFWDKVEEHKDETDEIAGDIEYHDKTKRENGEGIDIPSFWDRVWDVINHKEDGETNIDGE